MIIRMDHRAYNGKEEKRMRKILRVTTRYRLNQVEVLMGSGECWGRRTRATELPES